MRNWAALSLSLNSKLTSGSSAVVRKSKKILIVKPDLEILFVVVDLQGFVRFAEIGVACRDFQSSLSQRDLHRSGSFIGKNRDASDRGSYLFAIDRERFDRCFGAEQLRSSETVR